MKITTNNQTAQNMKKIHTNILSLFRTIAADHSITLRYATIYKPITKVYLAYEPIPNDFGGFVGTMNRGDAK